MSGIVSRRRGASALFLSVFLSQLAGVSLFTNYVAAQAAGHAAADVAPDTKNSAKRVALVIGNGSYRNVPSLKNTRNDAAAMAAKMQSLGYDVLYKTDLDRRSMNETISTFLTRVESGSEAFVYYSGHGVELNGSNYLLPIDIPALSSDQERMLRTEGSNLTDLLLDLESRSARVTLVILDACRDNPFRDVAGGVATRSLGATRGLGRVDPPRGTFVIFSAGVGEQAIDNLGLQDTDPNGLFTRKLLTLIDQNGLEIRPMVQKLRTEVRQAALTSTGRSQIPSYYDQLLGEFYFRPLQAKDREITENSCDRLVDADASGTSLSKMDLSSGLQACTAASAQFPNEIRFVRQLQAVQEQRMVQKALSSNQLDFSNAYVLLYPNGKYIGEIKAHIASLGDTPGPKPILEEPTKRPVVPPAVTTVVPQIDVGRVLQTELKRVGCDPIATDGIWGETSIEAMKRYNRIGRTKFDTARPSLAAVEALRTQKQQVCAVKIPSAVSSNKKLQPVIDHYVPRVSRPKPAAQKAFATAIVPKSSGMVARTSGRCVSFNGHTVCD